MNLTMRDIDLFIDTTINRLSSPNGTLHSSFYIDLRSLQSRITKNLVEECTSMCESRGLHVQRMGDGLSVTVDLNSCSLNPRQAAEFNTALAYTRQIYGNEV